jgi:Predicted membrane protein
MNTIPAENTPKKVNIKYITRLALLVALMVVMSFTPIGYLKVGFISVSFLCLPVILGAILMGPLAATILGLVFGISSFIAAFSDPVGVFLLGINPFLVFLSLVIPRILVGLGTGTIFKLFNAIRKTKAVAPIVTSIASSLLNSILYIIFLWSIFGNALIAAKAYPIGSNILTFAIGLIGFNTLFEVIICGTFGFAVGRIAAAVTKRAEAKKAAQETEFVQNSGAVVHDAFDIPILPDIPAEEEQ